jgi:hypothetical protein
VNDDTHDDEQQEEPEEPTERVVGRLRHRRATEADGLPPLFISFGRRPFSTGEEVEADSD